MQSQSEKGELVGELHGKSTLRRILEISPEGIKLESNDEAQFTGRYNAAHTETVTISLKTDGSNEWETKAVENTMEGDFIALWGKGTGKNTGPTTVTWEGEMHAMSQSPKLSWLNNAKLWVEGWADQAKNEFNAKIYLTK